MLRTGARKKTPVHFLHIGKTGGTAIKTALRDWTETQHHCVILHGHHTTLMQVPVGERAVFFLRDPVPRFVSGFYSRQRKGRPRYHSEWNPCEREVFAEFATPRDLASALADEHASAHALAVQAMTSIVHFKSYAAWYGDSDYFRSRLEDVLFVGFQESLERDFARLREMLGVHRGAELPTDDVAAHKSPRNLDTTLSQPGRAALMRWYAEDFEFVELCKQVMREKEMNSTFPTE